MPELRLNKDYEFISGTINAGQIDEQVTFSKLSNIYILEITNLDTTNAFSVRLNNKNRNALIVFNAGVSRTIDLYQIRDIKLTNSSGSNINYTIFAIGN